jgi:hypothetical protein
LASCRDLANRFDLAGTVGLQLLFGNIGGELRDLEEFALLVEDLVGPDNLC